MDVQQLKLLAGRLRGLLEQQNHELSHGQSLDVIAALPGLRNWPEVMAFPVRVAESELTEAATSRLSHRLRSRFGVEVAPLVLLQSLDPGVMSERRSARAVALRPSCRHLRHNVRGSHRRARAQLRRRD